MEQSLIDTILAIPSETQGIEFKRLGGESVVRKILQTMVAMANTEGGYIVLGVDDPEKTKLKGLDRIYGIEESLTSYDELEREIKNITPPLIAIWPGQIIEIPNIQKRVALLNIPKVMDSFRSINNQVFIRQEKGNRQITAHELIKFAYAKGFEKADKQVVDVRFDLLDTSTFQSWREARRLTGNIPSILERTGLARLDKEGNLKPTLAALLLFADFPSDQTETKCAIRVMQYEGTIETITDKPNLISVPKTIQGPLVQLLADAHEYVLTLLRTGIQVPSGFRTRYLIPERAIKEALTNAVIHRDYYIKRDIEVKIYEDRVEVESPGLLPYNITAHNIGHVRAEGYRNDLLVKHLREFPQPPNLDQNEGVRAMRAEMQAKDLYPPLFWSYPHTQDSVRVILLNEHRADEWEKISFYLSNHAYLSNEEARTLTGVVHRDKMSRLLNKWVSQGVLVKNIPSTGYVRGTRYKLPDSREIQQNFYEDPSNTSKK